MNYKNCESVFKDCKPYTKPTFLKADPLLINDLLVREQENDRPNASLSTSYYRVEILTNEGTESQRMSDVIHRKTGFLPLIHDNGKLVMC